MQIVHQAKPVVPRDRFIDLKELELLCCVKKSTIYQMLNERDPLQEINPLIRVALCMYMLAPKSDDATRNLLDRLQDGCDFNASSVGASYPCCVRSQSLLEDVHLLEVGADQELQVLVLRHLL